MLLPRPAIPFKAEKGVLAAAVGIVSSAILAPAATARDEVSSAYVAPDSSHSGVICSSQSHCYAVAETGGFIADGVAARFEVRNYTASDWLTGGSTAQALWLGVENSLPNRFAEWCELGWTKAFIVPTSGEPSGSYSQYYAFFVDNVYAEQFPTAVPLGPLGTSHHYQIHREFDGKYNFFIDNQDVGDCFASPFSLWAQVGLEYTSP